MQYGAANEGVIPKKDDDLITYLQTCPEGLVGVEYDISDQGRAVISQISTGDWFTTDDESLPISWE